MYTTPIHYTVNTVHSKFGDGSEMPVVVYCNDVQEKRKLKPVETDRVGCHDDSRLPTSVEMI